MLEINGKFSHILLVLRYHISSDFMSKNISSFCFSVFVGAENSGDSEAAGNQ